MVSFCNVPSLIPPTINRTTPQILSHFILNAFIATPRNSLFFRQGTISFSSNACIPSFGIDCYHSLRSIVLTSAQRSVKQILSIQAHSSSNTLEGRPANSSKNSLENEMFHFKVLCVPRYDHSLHLTRSSTEDQMTITRIRRAFFE